jgi:hypothetical protein
MVLQRFQIAEASSTLLALVLVHVRLHVTARVVRRHKLERRRSGRKLISGQLEFRIGLVLEHIWNEVVLAQIRFIFWLAFLSRCGMHP